MKQLKGFIFSLTTKKKQNMCCKYQSVVGISPPLPPYGAAKHPRTSQFENLVSQLPDWSLILICRCVYWSFTSDICWSFMESNMYDLEQIPVAPVRLIWNPIPVFFKVICICNVTAVHFKCVPMHLISPLINDIFYRLIHYRNNW